MKSEKIFVLIEEFSNDGAIECQVLGASVDSSNLQQKMNDQIEEYKNYGCFEDCDFESAEQDHNSYYVSNDDYYGKLDIVEVPFI